LSGETRQDVDEKKACRNLRHNSSRYLLESTSSTQFEEFKISWKSSPRYDSLSDDTSTAEIVGGKLKGSSPDATRGETPGINDLYIAQPLNPEVAVSLETLKIQENPGSKNRDPLNSST